MAHPAQKRFCKSVRYKYGEYFRRVNVIDIGSLNINGCNHSLFSRNSTYIGVDIVKGKNVNIVSKGHEYLQTVWWKGLCIDTIISTEALEHDIHYKETLEWMYKALRPGGLLLITCAGDGRKEHGTHDHFPGDSPMTNDYYCNVSNQMFSEILKPDMFSVYHLEQKNTDLQFYGIKNQVIYEPPTF
jgi:hypothetical protein